MAFAALSRPRFTLYVCIGLALAAGPRIGAAQQQVMPGPVAAGRLSFDGKATMGSFTGTSAVVSGEMTGGPDLESVRGWVEAPVATLKTGNDKRDRDLSKSMESGQYPMIRYELDGVTVSGWKGDSASVVLRGRFLIHGVTREVEFPADLIVGRDQVELRATTPLNLKDYRIGGLSKMLGTLKMHPDIIVRVELTFAPEPHGREWSRGAAQVGE